MRRTILSLSSITMLTLLAGCGGATVDKNDALVDHSTHTPPKAVVAASASQQAALLDRVKSLAGTWEITDEKGQKQTAAVFTVTSAGSAVREVMFPGSGHEMTNMYTMDGPTLVATHYCAQGNQPHMRARTGDGTPSDRIHLAYDGVGNFAGGDQMYMGDLTIVFKDADHIQEMWHSYSAGKPSGHDPVFELTRKR